MTPVSSDEDHHVRCRLDELLDQRDMTVAALSRIVGVSVVNLSVLKNNHGRAIRFSTLHAICEALGCDVGELLTVRPAPPVSEPPGSRSPA